MSDNDTSTEDLPESEEAAPAAAPTPPRRGPGHRGQDVRDTMAEMAAKAHEISLEAGSKMAAAMREVIGAAAGLTAFAIESARDLVQFMVRRGQMTQDEADKLLREVEHAHGIVPKTVLAPPPPPQPPRRLPPQPGADEGERASTPAAKAKSTDKGEAPRAAKKSAAPASKHAAAPVRSTKIPAKVPAKAAAKAPAKSAAKSATKGAVKKPAGKKR